MNHRLVFQHALRSAIALLVFSSSVVLAAPRLPWGGELKEGYLLDSSLTSSATDLKGSRQPLLHEKVVLDLLGDQWVKIGSTPEGWDLFARRMTSNADALTLEAKLVDRKQTILWKTTAVLPYGEKASVVPSGPEFDQATKFNLRALQLDLSVSKVRFELR
jgi:hypothetical protein